MQRKIRNVEVAGHRTSFRLEEAFWDAARDCAAELGVTMGQLATRAVETHGGGGVSMSSAMRVFLILHYRSRFLAARRGDPPA